MINNPAGFTANWLGSAKISDGPAPSRRPATRRPGRSAVLGPIEVGTGLPGTFPKSGVGFAESLQDIDQRSYHRIFEAFYRGTFAAGVPARLLHDEQLTKPDGLSPADVAAELPVLIVPGLLVAADELLDWLREYAAAGGHLVSALAPPTETRRDEPGPR